MLREQLVMRHHLFMARLSLKSFFKPKPGIEESAGPDI
jgi:hypothetical protein